METFRRGFPLLEFKARTEIQFALCAEQLEAAAKTQTNANAKTRATGLNTIKGWETDVRFRIELAISIRRAS
jgi:hypothetical protein